MVKPGVFGTCAAAGWLATIICKASFTRRTVNHRVLSCARSEANDRASLVVLWRRLVVGVTEPVS